MIEIIVAGVILALGILGGGVAREHIRRTEAAENNKPPSEEAQDSYQI